MEAALHLSMIRSIDPPTRANMPDSRFTPPAGGKSAPRRQSEAATAMHGGKPLPPRENTLPLLKELS
jgi:hypothetical protein